MTNRNTPISQLFADKTLRAVFAAAERNEKPGTFAVPAETPRKPLTGASGWRATPARLVRA